MFEPKRTSQDNLCNYIGARVTDAEEVWLRSEMRKRKMSMSNLIRLALGNLRTPKAPKAEAARSAK
jgi:hypothetical protein